MIDLLLFKFYNRYRRKENKSFAFTLACMDISGISVILLTSIFSLIYAFFKDIDDVYETLPYCFIFIVSLFFYCHIFRRKFFFDNYNLIEKKANTSSLTINILIIGIFALFLFVIIFVPWYTKGLKPW